jgi:hypothetical protein
MESKRIETFDDRKDTFQAWQKDINYDTKLFTSVLQGYEFSEKFADPKQTEIGFGEFGGARKWQNTTDIPRPEVKDLLLRLIAIQGGYGIRLGRTAAQTARFGPDGKRSTEYRENQCRGDAPRLADELSLGALLRR